MSKEYLNKKIYKKIMYDYDYDIKIDKNLFLILNYLLFIIFKY
jgi:hypothetical protein